MRLAPSHIGLCISDLERSVRFYEGLGFQRRAKYTVSGQEIDQVLELPGTNMRGQFLQLDHLVIELLEILGPGIEGAFGHQAFNRPGLTHLSFEVDDIQAASHRIRALGGDDRMHTLTTFAEFGDGTNNGSKGMMCADPDGNRIELLKTSGPTGALSPRLCWEIDA